MLCDGSVAVISFVLSADWSVTRLWQYTSVLKEQYTSVLKERFRMRGTPAASRTSRVKRVCPPPVSVMSHHVSTWFPAA